MITPKKLFSSPKPKDESSSTEENNIQAALKYAKHQEAVESHQGASLQELHQNRLNSIRKELLDHIKKTEWKYEPIEKYIGQSSQQQ